MAGFTGYDPERNSYVVEGNLVGNMSPEAFNQIVKNVTGQSFTGQQAPAQTQTQQAPAQTQAQAQQAPQEDTQPKMLYGGDGSLEKLIGGKPRFLTFQDPETGRTFNYDYEEQEYKGLGPGYYNAGNLQLIGGMGESKSKEGEFVSVSIDPDKFTYGGKQTPEQADKAAKEAAREPGYESGGGGLFYEYEGTKYYTPDNSGQGIPVGSTDITRDPGSKDITDPNNPEYSPVLTKGFSTYYDQNEINPNSDLFNQQQFNKFQEDIIPKSKPLTLGNVFSLTPGGAVIDTGLANPFGEGNIEFSNPPSQLQDLGPFFNLAESFGYQNLKESYKNNPLAESLGLVAPTPSIGEIIQNTGGSNVAPPSTTKDPDPSTGGGGGGGDDPDPDPDKDKPKRTTFFAPAKRSDPISTAPDEPINTDPRFQPIFPQQPIQPKEPPLTNFPNPYEGPFGPDTPITGGPAMPQPEPIPIEAIPPFMPIVSPTPQQPQTFADVMHRGGAKGPPGINPYFQDIEQINRTAPYTSIMGIATNPMMLKDGGGIMSLRNRMLMAPASQAMTKGIMS